MPPVFLVASLAAAEARTPPDPRPSVLLIVADDLGYTDLGVTGGEISTPNLDALARSGLLLTSFLVSPACSPTRAMLLTGVDTHPAGLGTMAGEADESQKGRPGYEGQLSDRIVSVATLLREAGYHTYISGKWHLGMEDRLGPHRQGFERSFALLQGGASHFQDAAPITERGAPPAYREDGREVSLPAGFYSTEHFTDRLIAQIRDGLADGKPFFAYAAYTSPHWPLQAPDADLDLYAGAYDTGYDALQARRFEAARRLGLVPPEAVPPSRTPFAPAWETLAPEAKRREARTMEVYAAMVENLDRHVGRLVQFLRDAGRYESTLVLFFSDNGPEGNPIGRLRTNAEWLPRRFDNRLARLGREGSYAWLGPGWAQATTPFRLWKSFPTEGGVRVPAIVRFYLFTSTDNGTLELFHAETLEGPYRPHPRSPVVSGDDCAARPGGRPVVWHGRLLRFAQCDRPAYGVSVRAFEVTELSPCCYGERPAGRDPLLAGSGAGWNAGGMHHLDPLVDAGGVLAAVDGWRPVD